MPSELSCTLKFSHEAVHYCLFRTHIPVELRVIIVNFAYEALDDTNIHSAVNMWCGSEAQAILRYGYIRTWDTSQVTIPFKKFVDFYCEVKPGQKYIVEADKTE